MHNFSLERRYSVSLFDLVDVVEALEESKNSLSKLFAFICIILILIINIPLLKIILKQSTTVINMLIAADCIICVGNSIVLFNILIRPFNNPVLCLVSAPYAYLINLLSTGMSLSLEAPGWRLNARGRSFQQSYVVQYAQQLSLLPLYVFCIEINISTI